MAKLGNESRLVLTLAKERMEAELLHWRQLSSNPNSVSNNENWMAGYQYCFDEWKNILHGIANELERS
jgi:hypothetical protein